MQRILAATDGSDSAERALAVAAELARALAAQLWIVCIADPGGLSRQEIEEVTRAEHLSLGDLLESRAAQILENARERAEAMGVARCHLKTRAGDPAYEIAQIAREERVDAIVVGKRGHGLLSELLLGSVAHKLVSSAGTTVIVVP